MNLDGRKVISDFKDALKRFKPLVENPKFLRDGRPLADLSILPREAWANFLVCLVFRACGDPHVTVLDDTAGDGFLFDLETSYYVSTEHVSRLDVPSKKPLLSGDDGILQAIDLKINREPEYAKGKYLIVFFEGVGEFIRKNIRERVRGRHNFLMIIGVGLLSQSTEGYKYAVIQFHEFHSVTYIVSINKSFTDWKVELFHQV